MLLVSSGGSKGGARDASPPGPKFLHFHTVFGKNWSNNRLAPLLWGWRPILWEILEPLVSFREILDNDFTKRCPLSFTLYQLNEFISDSSPITDSSTHSYSHQIKACFFSAMFASFLYESKSMIAKRAFLELFR